MNDVLFVFVSLIIVASVSLVSYDLGKQSVVSDCNTYGAHKISKDEMMMCVVKPNFPYKYGDLNYKEKLK